MATGKIFPILAVTVVLAVPMVLAGSLVAAQPAPGGAPTATSQLGAPVGAKPDAATEAAAPQPTTAPLSSPTPPADKVAAGTGSALIPHDLSPYGMFMNADIVVKAVMIGLAFASLVTWTLLLAKAVELLGARRRAGRGVAELARAGSLGEAAAKIAGRDTIVARLVAAAVDEGQRSQGLGAEGVKERAAALLGRIEARAGRAMGRGTGLLATIGSTAPFVGLFGTVWGIMNSFIGISKTNTTNLAVVAPGIAEALLATATGLVAAIPAVIIYNMFAREITGYRQVLGDASTEVLRLLSRDLDRGLRAAPRQAAE